MTEPMAESPRPTLDSALAAQVQQALAHFEGIELAIVMPLVNRMRKERREAWLARWNTKNIILNEPDQ